jgi:hypothetical protein
METKTQKKKNRIIMSDGETEISFTNVETSVTLRAAQYTENLLTAVAPQPYSQARKPPRRERFVLIQNAQRSIIWNDVSTEQSLELTSSIAKSYLSAPGEPSAAVH